MASSPFCYLYMFWLENKGINEHVSEMLRAHTCSQRDDIQIIKYAT